MVELVRFDIGIVKDKVYNAYTLMPAILILFAQGARVHSGLRLFNRASRYDTVIFKPDIRDSKINIGYYKM